VSLQELVESLFVSPQSMEEELLGVLAFDRVEVEVLLLICFVFFVLS